MAFRDLLVNVGLVVGRVAAKYDPSGVAEHVLDAYRNQRDKQQLRLELEALMQASFDQFRGELRDAMNDNRLQLPDEARAAVEAFLCQFQASARQAARQFGDPSATTVPATIAIDSADSLAAFLPQRPPRFKVGDSVPGLPSWKLVEPLGAGGFGEAWKATHPYEGEAAFKFFTDPTARQHFTEAEAAALHEIHRRAPTTGVVKLLSAEPHQDPPYLKLEYCAGGDLSRLPDEWKNLSNADRVRRVREMIRSLSATVGHFHNLSVVHRDLKPSNVLRRTDGSLAVADFGISKILPASGTTATPRNASQATIFAYTANYASPQQKRRLPHDLRDDIYSLAVLWYQLLRADLTLERPSGDGWKEVLKKLGVSASDVALLNRCWDDEPSIRPANGSDLAAIMDAETEERKRATREQAQRNAAELERMQHQHRKRMLILMQCLLVIGAGVGVSVAVALWNKPGSSAVHVETLPLPTNPKAGDVFTIAVGERMVKMNFCWIPPGSFQMGGNGQSDNPKRNVSISKGFWMGQTEVTQAQWRIVNGHDPSHYKSDDRPVECVSWDDSQEFCRKLAGMTRVPIRLPTEAEWEYACRAGTTSDYSWPGGVEALQLIGWFKGNSNSQTQPVGKLAANAWGLHDVHGNVWEWCQDSYGGLSPDPQTDPVAESGISPRVVRGGAWLSNPAICLSAYRGGNDQKVRFTFNGLRVCFRPDR